VDLSHIHQSAVFAKLAQTKGTLGTPASNLVGPP